MKQFLLYFCFAISCFSYSQTFINPELPFEKVQFGNMSYGDIDGDNDLDVLITGESNFIGVAKLYRNNGKEHFTEITGTPFTGVVDGFSQFADIDGDLDNDLLIAGRNDSGTSITKLYRNDGSGNFTEITGTPFSGYRYGDVDFTDVNGDLSLDLLLTGTGDFTRLYLNDGSGNFTEATGTTFPNLFSSSVDFADVDGDLDQDMIIIGGLNTADVSRTFLYLNDGAGNFTLDTNNTFQRLSQGDVEFADLDGDLDNDLIISGGFLGVFTSYTKVYLNNGSGIFTENTSNNFNYHATDNGDISLADIDGDLDLDLAITGSNFNNSNDDQFGLYVNDGSGNFTHVPTPIIKGQRHNKIGFIDIDNDGDNDMHIIGHNAQNNGSIVYRNYNSGSFHYEAYQFDGSNRGEMIYHDFNGDTYIDLLYNYPPEPTNPKSVKVYHNIANEGYYLEDTNPNFAAGLQFNETALGDINGDNIKDVIFSGNIYSASQKIIEVQVADALGNFTPISSSSLQGVNYGDITIVDVNGDLNNDVLISGFDSSDNPTTKLYTNDGTGVFTEITTSFVQVQWSTQAFADIDGDLDQDVIIIGHDGTSPIAKLYTNDGSGVFTEVNGTPFPGIFNGDVIFEDVDGDLDQDLFLSGTLAGNSQTSKLYINNGSGVFTENTNNTFEPLMNASAAFGDIDGDSDQDLIISGYTASIRSFTSLYINDGSGTFTQLPENPFIAIAEGDVAFADVDGDNDLDIHLTGLTNISPPSISRIYINEMPQFETNPPVANCVAPFTVYLDNTGNATITANDIDNSSTDDSGIDTLSIDITNFSCSDIGSTITVTLTVTDIFGNMATCSTDITVASPPIIYVNQNATGNNTGESWANAYTSLQSAIDATASCSNTNAIWVASGTYKPSAHPRNTTGGTLNDRDFTFHLVNDVDIYGGFNGTETDINQRDVNANQTILSGDIGVIADVSDNTNHVLLAVGITNATLIDGFTIQEGDGHSNTGPVEVDGVSIIKLYGAGAHIYNSNITFSNCTFTNNRNLGGGGVYVNSSLITNISNCTFTSNNAPEITGLFDGFGGAVANTTNSILDITNSTFTTNSATTGGAISNQGNLILTASTITNNSALNGGNAILNNGTLTGKRSFIINNGGDLFNPGFQNFTTIVLSDCVMSNTLFNNSGGNATFNNITLYDAIAQSDLSGNIEFNNTVMYSSGGIPNILLANGGTISGTNNYTSSDPNIYGNPTGFNHLTSNPFLNASDLDGADDSFGTPDDGLTLINVSSVLYDAGNNALVIENIDIKNQPRVIGNAVDIGAYELASNTMLNLNVFLSGPLSGNLMANGLRNGGHIPTTSPYADTATCDPSVFNVTGNDAIIDWVWIELRNETDNTQIDDSISALLQADGDIVSTDGINDISKIIPSGNYYILVNHRNHFGVMTANTVSSTSLNINLDFTDGSVTTYGTNAQLENGGIYSLWAGNGNNDNILKFSGDNNDSNPLKADILNASGNILGLLTYSYSGYHNTDYNLNGAAVFSGNNNDSNILKSSVLSHPSNFLSLLTFQIIEQLP